MSSGSNYAALAPKARDMAIQKEVLTGFSNEKGDAAVAGYEKYRSFVDNDQ